MKQNWYVTKLDFVSNTNTLKKSQLTKSSQLRHNHFINTVLYVSLFLLCQKGEGCKDWQTLLCSQRSVLSLRIPKLVFLAVEQM